MYTIPIINTALEPSVCWSGAFTDEELAAIISMGDNLEFQEAKVGGGIGKPNSSIRSSKVSWVKPDEQNSWLFNKTVELISRVNTDKYQFELSHIDSFQYTTYTTGGFYTWHIDGDVQDTFGSGHRKLGISILLSDPTTEFAGGEFQIIPGGNPDQIETMALKKGDMLVFPAFVPHQVNKVTAGKRRSLVCWVLGPKFK